MSTNIFKKYNLPQAVKVKVSKTPEGTFVATFPDLLGCFTEADNVVDLIYQVNDALFTYYDVSRKDLNGVDFLYSPPQDFLKDIANQKVEPYEKSEKRSFEFRNPFPSTICA